MNNRTAGLKKYSSLKSSIAKISIDIFKLDPVVLSIRKFEIQISCVALYIDCLKGCVQHVTSSLKPAEQSKRLFSLAWPVSFA